jgi:hypothetical protein
MKEFKDSEIVYENNQSDKAFAIIGKHLSEGMARTKDVAVIDRSASFDIWGDSLLPSFSTPKKPQSEWASRIIELRSHPRIRSYTTIARLLGVNQVSVMRWAKGGNPPSMKSRRAIERLEIQLAQRSSLSRSKNIRMRRKKSLWQRIKAGLRVVKG